MKTLIFLILLLFTNCTHTIHNHGVPGLSIESWSRIKVGDDKEKVIHLLGAPTLVSKFDENTFYYTSYRIKQANFLGKRKYSSKSLQISFNHDNKVAEIKEINVSESPLASINN